MRTGTRIIGGDLTSLESNAAKTRFQKFRGPVALVCNLLQQRQGDVCAEEMVTMLGCRGRQARKIFHYVVGESFRSAQLRARLMPARHLVQNTSQPIATIAARFGYSRRAKFDQSYTTLFRVTPAQDRLICRFSPTKSATQGVDTNFQQVYRAAPTTEL